MLFCSYISGKFSHIFQLLVSNLIPLRSETNLNSLKLLRFVLWKNLTAWFSHSPSCILSTHKENTGLHLGFSSPPCSLKTCSLQQAWEVKALTSFVSHHSDIIAPHCLMSFVIYSVCFLSYFQQEDKSVLVTSSWLQVSFYHRI